MNQIYLIFELHPIPTYSPTYPPQVGIKDEMKSGVG